jgi:methionine sulfoxide reductase heme-binding subunit
MTPWTDRSGRISPLKLVTFLGTFVPGILLAIDLWTGAAGPKPVEVATHTTGDWAIRFLFLSLAVTPMRRIADWPRLIMIRRMLGLAALAYVVVHLGLYVIDQNYDLARVASEIVLRVYLTIGFVALVGLCVLGWTSRDAAIRRMGALAWNRLHRIVYAIAILAIVHFFLQSKANVGEATLMSGLFGLLMAYRIMHKRGIPLSPVPLVIAAVAATAATAAIEFVWYAAATGIDPTRVFLANFDFSYTIRPAWWVGATGLLVAIVGAVRRGPARARPRGRKDRLAPEMSG